MFGNLIEGRPATYTHTEANPVSVIAGAKEWSKKLTKPDEMANIQRSFKSGVERRQSPPLVTSPLTSAELLDDVVVIRLHALTDHPGVDL